MSIKVKDADSNDKYFATTGDGTSSVPFLAIPANYIYQVALGNIDGAAAWHKFGYNSDVDTAAEEVIASFGGSINIMTSADTLDVVSDDANDTSAGTGAQSVLITGIDENHAYQIEVVTMNGVTPVTTTNSWLGVNRVVVLSSGSGNVNAGNITVDDNGGTVGVQAYIPAGDSTTQQMIFHTEISKTFLMSSIVINALKLSGGGGSPRITVKGFSYSRVTETTYEVFRKNIDTSLENTLFINFDVPLVFTGREVIYFTATTDVNNTEVSGRFTGILTDS
jgi:hypothetical protein